MSTAVMTQNKYQTCIDECNKCAQACYQCFKACLNEPDVNKILHNKIYLIIGK